MKTKKIFYNHNENNPLFLITPCPNGEKRLVDKVCKVGSATCQACEYFVKQDKVKKQLECCHPNYQLETIRYYPVIVVDGSITTAGKSESFIDAEMRWNKLKQAFNGLICGGVLEVNTETHTTTYTEL